jgi:rod shape-determining protein MreB and related proteins
MGLFNFSKAASIDLGIDLGTVNTLICTTAQGIVLREPSVVAIDQSFSPPQVLEVGTVARDMIGRTPGNIKAVRPLKDGVIADFEWAEVMLKQFIERVVGPKKLFGASATRVVVGLPSIVTDVEKRAVGEAAAEASGARYVHLIEEPMAAAIGAGLPVDRPTGSMIVDIGGGTTEIAVLSLNGIVVTRSIRVAGDELNEAIQAYLKLGHNLSIGERTAESIKIRLGSVTKATEDEAMSVRGLNLENGLPHTVTVYARDIRECMRPTLLQMVQAVRETLESTPPELAADIYERGITLAGGGALLSGLDTLISEQAEVPVHIANDPLSCVVLGTEKVLSDPSFQKILNYTEYDGRY